MGYGLTKDLVEVVIYDYLRDNDIPNPFTGGVPGRDWWQRFLKRWPCLSERKPQHLSKKRAQAGNGDIINAWFDKLDEVFSSAGLDPHNPSVASRLWNCDETAFCTSPVFLIQDGHHSHISLELIRRAHDNNIVILCLPPNTTHLLQPFDIAIFAPVKKEWKKILKQYKLETKGQKVRKEVFPKFTWQTVGFLFEVKPLQG